MRLLRTGQARIGVVFAARHVRNVLDRTVQVGDAAPVRVQRTPAQLGRGRMVGVGQRRRDRIQQRVATQAACQQIIAVAMRADALRREGVGRRGLGGRRACVHAGSQGQ
jgi:hypothetical protein